MKTLQENVKSKKSNDVKNPGKRQKNSIKISTPSVETIREKANEIYLQRMERGESGSAEGDWVEAEKYLLDSDSNQA